MDDWPSPAQATVFLDFDGTLVDIAPTPESICIPDDLRGLLEGLFRATKGRVALLTGREVDAIQSFLPAFSGQIIGCHGAEVWDGQARTVVNVDEGALANAIARARASDLAANGVTVEAKPVGLVLHYRAVPKAAASVQLLADELCADLPEHCTLAGKMSVEIRPASIGKEMALATMMRRSETKATTPMFFGDDTTDLPALSYVKSAGGVAGFIGDQIADVPLTFATPAALRKALTQWMNRYE